MYIIIIIMPMTTYIIDDMLTLLWVQAVCRWDTPFQGQDDQCGHRDHYKQTWFSESSNYGNNDDGDDYEKDHGQENERRWW